MQTPAIPSPRRRHNQAAALRIGRVIAGAWFLLLFAGSAAAQDVRITEFLALNATGLVDEDGTPSPWIEIRNPSTTAKVSLNGWKLRNNTSEWTFPSVEIPPDAYLLVWASGKTRSVVTAPLHTNFILSPTAGSLSLLRSDNSVASTVTYPDQQTDMSYGRDLAEQPQVGFYSVPSPGESNNYSGPGVAGEVSFSLNSRTFTSPLSLTIAQVAPIEGAVIRYTTNGTVPLSTSPLYTGPLTVSLSQVIRARVFTPGLLPGETETRAFMLLDANSSAFSSPIPIVLISNFGQFTPPATGDQDGYMWVFEPGADKRSRLTATPTLVTRIAMDRRGSTTLNNPKFNLNVETRKARDNDDRNVSLLGMPDGSDWVFAAPYDYDRSLLHNPFVYALSNLIGRPAMRNRMAEVFMDVDGAAVTYTGGASGNYFGVYNVMEKIRRDRNRINLANLREHDNTSPAVTGGYIVKVDRKDTGDIGFQTQHEGSAAGTLGFAYYEPKEIELLSPQRDPQEQYIKKFLTDFDLSCYSANYTDPNVGYPAYLDIGAAIDHHLLNVLPMNVDGLRLSGYMYKDRGGKLVYGPVWDYDRSLESTDARDDAPKQWRGTPLSDGDAGTDFFNYTWWKRLFGDIEFYQKYIDRYAVLRRGAFSDANINALLESLNSEITDEAANRDVTRWGRLKRAYTSTISGMSYTGQRAEVERIKDWLQLRQEFMDSQWVSPVTINPAEGNVAFGTTVTMTGLAGATIYYTTDGSDPRPTGGGVPSAPNVQVYTSPIVVNATTRIRARAYNPNHVALTGTSNPPLASKWSGRTDARFATDTPATTGAILVTEINYNPLPPTAQELAVDPLFTDADFEFLELKNVSANTIDLAGLKFTAGITFTFADENAISLDPGQFAIVAANPKAFTARYGAKPNVVGPFGADLSNAGERLTIADSNSAVLVDFTFDDVWYTETDGAGYTLVLHDQFAPSSTSNLSTGWRASAVLGGSPGADEPPFATTLAATSVTIDSAVLHGIISGNGPITTPTFILGDQRIPLAPVPGTGAKEVEYTINGLLAHTKYSFSLEAANTLGTRLGNTLEFTTLNRAPSTTDKTFHIRSRAAFDLEVLTGSTDPDGDDLSVIAVSQGAAGAVEIVGNKVVYSPAPEYDGNDSFTFTVGDGYGGEVSGTVILRNLLPVAGDDYLVCNAASVILDPRENDFDADGDPLVITSATNGSHGQVQITPEGTLLYTPGADYFGEDTFSYTISDGSAFEAATVRLRNTLPVLIPGPVKGGQVPGQPPGTVYGELALGQGGMFTGSVIAAGRKPARAIFASDGSVILKVGDPAPLIAGATIGALGDLSGQAVIVTLKGVSKGADTVLYAGLPGSVRLVVRESDLFIDAGPVKQILSADGHGETVFFTAKRGGAGTKPTNDLFLVANVSGENRVLFREGDLAEGVAATSLATLLGSRPTLAEGRWRLSGNGLGARITGADKQQLLASFDLNSEYFEPVVWASTRNLVTAGAVTKRFGLPGWSIDGVAVLCELARNRARGITKANDLAVVRMDFTGSAMLARKGSPATGPDGNPLEAIFSGFTDPVAGALGRTAFVATLAGSGVNATNRTGIWYALFSTTYLIARTGDEAPGGGRWSAFESLVLPEGDESAPVFTGRLVISRAENVSAGNNRGLWAIDSTGTLQLLLRTGQPISINGANRTVKSFTALTPAAGCPGSANGYDDNRHVYAVVTCTDGTQAAVRIAIP